MMLAILSAVAAAAVVYALYTFKYFKDVEEAKRQSYDDGYAKGLTAGAIEGVKIGYDRGVDDTTKIAKKEFEKINQMLDSRFNPPKPTPKGKTTPTLHKLEKPTHLKMVKDSEEKTPEK